MSKRAAKKKANREAILIAAKAVFATIGYDASTVRDIVRRSGLASGSYYNYFADKEEVFTAIATEIFEPLTAALRGARQLAETPQSFLERPYRVVANLALDDPQTAAIVRQNQTVFRQRFYLSAAKSDIQSDLEADLRRWIEAGFFREHDPVLMTEAMLSLGLDLLIQVALDPGSADDRLRFIVEFFASALAPA